jgi:hypothetical protein
MLVRHTHNDRRKPPDATQISATAFQRVKTGNAPSHISAKKSAIKDAAEKKLTIE